MAGRVAAAGHHYSLNNRRICVGSNRLWWKRKTSSYIESLASGAVPVMRRDALEVVLDIASIRGIGLVGPGAITAVRALAAHMLAAPYGMPTWQVIIPEPDLATLLNGQKVGDFPGWMTIPPTLETTMDGLETMLRGIRVHGAHAAERPRSPWPNPILICQPSPSATGRLRSMLGNDIPGVFIGHWKPGATVYVRSDGLVTEASLGTANALVSRWLYDEPAAELDKLLAVVGHDDDLRTIEPEPTRDRKPLSLSVLGRVELRLQHGTGTRDITDMISPKQQEILVCMATGLDKGVRRDVLNRAIWPDTPSRRPYNSLHNALSLLRRTMANETDDLLQDVVVRSGTDYRINGDLVDVDYWQLQQELERGSLGVGDRTDQLERAVTLYRGDLAESCTSLWIETPREALRRSILDALSVLVKQGSMSGMALAVKRLEEIRQRDLYNESVYRDIIRAHIATGQLESARRTYALLVKVLKETGQRPESETVNLFVSRRRDSSPPTSIAAS
jgi:DNA-binding SARP family transcriptional activator